jgi:hypothetical protein
MIDPQVAASDTMVAVLTWDTLSFYDKSGTLLPSTPSFTNPTNTRDAVFRVHQVARMHGVVLRGTQDHEAVALRIEGDARVAHLAIGELEARIAGHVGVQVEIGVERGNDGLEEGFGADARTAARRRPTITLHHFTD